MASAMPASWRTCPGLKASITFSRTVGRVPWRCLANLAPPAIGEARIGGTGVLRTGKSFHEAAVLEPRHHMGQSGRSRVGLRRQRTHPQRPFRRLREHGQNEVFEVHQPGIATQLRVEHPGQQLQNRRKAHPRRPLTLTQAFDTHATIVPQSCSYNYHLLR